MIGRALYLVGMLALAFVGPCALSSEIVEAASYAEVEKAFEGADAGTLGIFDVEDVLIYSSDPAFQKANWRSNQQFVKCLMKAMTPDQRWLFINFSHMQGAPLPVDADAWAAIKRIQERNVKTIALTASMPGLLGDEYLPEWRYKQLKKLGFDFSASFPAEPSFCMNNLEYYLGRYPAFYKGILFANGELRLKAGRCNKANVLVEFITRVHWRPKKIIFVDDNRDNLAAVEKTLSLYDPDIQFVGVHFTFAPPHQEIYSEEFEARWERVVSLVSEWECKHPSRCFSN